MLRRFFGGLIVGLVLALASGKAPALTVKPDFGKARFISGKLPAHGFPGMLDLVYATNDDILIPFLPNFPKRYVSALWSVRRQMIIASGLTIGKEQDGLPTLGITEFEVIRQVQLLDFDMDNLRGLLGKTRVRLPDDTFLEQSGLGSLNPCEPISNYFFLVEDREGHLLRRKAFLSYASTAKEIDWNGDRCTEMWGEGAIVKAAVHYETKEYFTLSLIGDKILFIGSEGSFLRTNAELDGPTVNSALVTIDLDVLNTAMNEGDGLSGGALLEARDAALGRALGQRQSK